MAIYSPFIPTNINQLQLSKCGSGGNNQTNKKIKNITLTQTDAQSLPGDATGTGPNFLPVGFINADGTRVYVVYSSFPGTAPNPAAQFGTVSAQGKITFNVSIPLDPVFVNVDDGFANQSFTEFTLLEDDGSGNGRIRVINSSGATLATHVFTDVAPGGVFAGGSWSYDDQYVSVIYTLSQTPTTTTSVIRILDRNLNVLASTASFPFSGQDPLWFTIASDCACSGKFIVDSSPIFPLNGLNGLNSGLCCGSGNGKSKSKKDKCCIPPTPITPTALGTGYYLSISVGNVNSSAGIAGSGCPNYLRIYQFTGNQIIQIAQQQLPAFGVGNAVWPNKPVEIINSCNVCETCPNTNDLKQEKDKEKRPSPPVRKIRKFALIAVNTIVATATTEVSPYVVPTPSCISNDSNELKLFAFDGSNLVLVTSKNTRGRSGGMTFTPDGKFLLFEEVARAFIPDAEVQPTPAAAILVTARVPLKQICKFFTCEESKDPCRDPCRKDKNNDKDKWCCNNLSPFTTLNLINFNNNFIGGNNSGLELVNGACLEIVDVQLGYANSFILSVSGNQQWLFIAGAGPNSGANIGDVFPIQLYHIDPVFCSK